MTNLTSGGIAAAGVKALSTAVNLGWWHCLEVPTVYFVV